MVTREELVTALEPDEVNYARLMNYFGGDALPLLRELITGPRPDIAAKATSLAGLIEGPDRLAALELASRSPHDVVRIAAASAAGSVPTSEAERLVPSLLEDDDPSVRKLAIRAAGRVGSHPRVREALDRIRREDPIEALRASAGTTTNHSAQEDTVPSDDEIIERAIARFGPVIDLRTNAQDFIDVVRATAVDVSPDGGLPPGGTPPPPGPTSMQVSEATLDDVMAEVLNLSRRLTEATKEISDLRRRLDG